jgi:phage pi2 protein 07
MAHIVSTTQPPNGALGDEWYNPTTNKLYKLVVLSGTGVAWQDYSNTLSSISAGNNIAIAANGQISATISAGNNISIAANGQISSTASGGGGGTVSGNVETTFTAKQLFTGNATSLAMKMVNAAEAIVISTAALGGSGNVTANIDLANSAIIYYTTAATNNWAFNFRHSNTVTLNSTLANSESVSAVLMVTQGTNAYFANAVQIDGVTQVPKWQDAFAPTGGNPSSVDIYNFTIIKTANASYTVLGSQSRFA